MSRKQYSTDGGIPVRAGNQVVGQVVEGKFHKRVRGSKHMLREPKGWAVDVQSFQDARDLGAQSIEIEDTESGVTYAASVEHVLSRGFRFDRGHGPQICLPLRFWSVHRPGEAEQLAFALA